MIYVIYGLGFFLLLPVVSAVLVLWGLAGFVSELPKIEQEDEET